MNEKNRFIVEVVVALIVIFFFFKEIRSGAFSGLAGAGGAGGSGAGGAGGTGSSGSGAGGCGCNEGCGCGAPSGLPTVPSETFSNPGSYEYLETTGGGQGTKLVVSATPIATSNSILAFNSAAANALIPN